LLAPFEKWLPIQVLALYPVNEWREHNRASEHSKCVYDFGLHGEGGGRRLGRRGWADRQLGGQGVQSGRLAGLCVTQEKSAHCQGGWEAWPLDIRLARPATQRRWLPLFGSGRLLPPRA